MTSPRSRRAAQCLAERFGFRRGVGNQDGHGTRPPLDRRRFVKAPDVTPSRAAKTSRHAGERRPRMHFDTATIRSAPVLGRSGVKWSNAS